MDGNKKPDLAVGGLLGLACGVGLGATLGAVVGLPVVWLALSGGGLIGGIALGARVSRSRK